mmetsp:Transcript_4785/g.14420  ORF Transcript_4785/g.14420 Transcript_4785/m.14420 type:complete len:212 (-) Transcript_4785:681-1316(-)
MSPSLARAPRRDAHLLTTTGRAFLAQRMYAARHILRQRGASAEDAFSARRTALMTTWMPFAATSACTGIEAKLRKHSRTGRFSRVSSSFWSRQPSMVSSICTTVFSTGQRQSRPKSMLRSSVVSLSALRNSLVRSLMVWSISCPYPASMLRMTRSLWRSLGTFVYSSPSLTWFRRLLASQSSLQSLTTNTLARSASIEQNISRLKSSYSSS